MVTLRRTKGAQGIGWGFNVAYPQVSPGTGSIFDEELKTTKRPSLSVAITETGWATHHQGLPSCTETEKVDWTVDAYMHVWRNDPGHGCDALHVDGHRVGDPKNGYE